MRRTLLLLILLSVYVFGNMYGNTNPTDNEYSEHNSDAVYAAEAEQEPFCMLGENYYANTYSRYSDTIKSYLVPVPEGYMRVQGMFGSLMENDTGQFGVEYYSSQFQRISYKTIPKDLPIWGGFCSYNGYYYVVTGQTNESERDDLDVIMVTKYDTDWNRIDAVGISDINVTRPFEAGSCSIVCYKNNLVIRMSREMYRADDGLRHQANKTMLIDTEKMEVKAKDFGGYVSHSFNQIIRFNGNRLLAVDHGDAYPRAIVFYQYIKRGDDKVGLAVNKEVEVLKIKGEKGDNITRAAVGDLQFSSKAYLIVGSSIDQDPNSDSRAHNIYVGAINYKTVEPELKWITNYTDEDSPGVGDPYLIKLNREKFLLMWNENLNKGNQTLLKSVYLDANGDCISDVYESKAILTDCYPVVNGDKIVWYAWEDGKTTFYQMSAEDPASFQKTVSRQKMPQQVLVEGLKKKVSYARLKKTNQKVKPVRVHLKEGKLTYSGVGVNAKSKKALKIDSRTGAVTIKKHTRKGVYKMKVKVTAAGNKYFLPGSDKTIVRILVR